MIGTSIMPKETMCSGAATSFSDLRFVRSRPLLYERPPCGNGHNRGRSRVGTLKPSFGENRERCDQRGNSGHGEDGSQAPPDIKQIAAGHGANQRAGASDRVGPTHPCGPVRGRVVTGRKRVNADLRSTGSETRTKYGKHQKPRRSVDNPSMTMNAAASV